MVEFYRHSPEYQYKEANFVWYTPLFEDIDNQEERVECHGSNGYGSEQDIDQSELQPVPKEQFLINYFVDGELALTIKNVVITISGKGMTKKSYNFINDPDHIRLSSDDACVMGWKDKIVYFEDGTPDVDSTPAFHTVKCMFNEFPVDNMKYVIDVIGENDEVVFSKSGTISIVDPPWDIS